MGGFNFADSRPLEQRLTSELWKWESLPESDRPSVMGFQSQIANLIEYYLGGVFHHKNSARSSGWWCDGVGELSISKIDKASFLMIGVADWAISGHTSSPFYHAPFEIEFHFDTLRASMPTREVIRFGRLGLDGEIERTPISSNPWRLTKKRSRQDQDWAFAIELTNTP